MDTRKISEFLTVLVVALVIGAAAMWVTSNLTGPSEWVAAVILAAVAVAALSFLRRYHGRR